MTQGRSVCNRIRNARASLDNAERSFRSNQDMRGELDLMLAEAELDNLRRKRTGWVSWTRHTLALCLAVMVLAAGGLGWWWASAYGVNTTNAADRQQVSGMRENGEIPGMKQESAIIPEKKETLGSERKDASSVKQVPIVHKTEEVKKPEIRTESRNVQLSDGQMRQLIRSGKQELGNIR